MGVGESFIIFFFRYNNLSRGRYCLEEFIKLYFSLWGFLSLRYFFRENFFLNF